MTAMIIPTRKKNDKNESEEEDEERNVGKNKQECKRIRESRRKK